MSHSICQISMRVNDLSLQYAVNTSDYKKSNEDASFSSCKSMFPTLTQQIL